MKAQRMNKITIEGSDMDPYVKSKLMFMAKGTGKTEKQVVISLIEWAMQNESGLLKAMQQGLIKAM